MLFCLDNMVKFADFLTLLSETRENFFAYPLLRWGKEPVRIGEKRHRRYVGDISHYHPPSPIENVSIT